MDGLEATAIIRPARAPEGEGEISCETHPHHRHDRSRPGGDRDRRLAAGMEDYVSKPINANDLFAAIGRVMPAASQAHA
jgi:CheY-like chemotaxis protein